MCPDPVNIVLEEMGESGSPGQFVLRADVIPDVDGHGRRGVVGGQHHREPVRQRVGLEWNVDRALRGERHARGDDQNGGSKALHDRIMN
jgi:hypothetical protein